MQIFREFADLRIACTIRNLTYLDSRCIICNFLLVFFLPFRLENFDAYDVTQPTTLHLSMELTSIQCHVFTSPKSVKLYRYETDKIRLSSVV